MFSKLIAYIKNNKPVVYVVLGVLVLIYVLIWEMGGIGSSLSEIQRPVSVQKPSTPQERVFTLVSTDPIDASRLESNTSAIPILFEFSEPIDVDTLVIKVFPKIDFYTNVPEGKPNTLVVFPLEQGWQDQVSYRITIAELKSTSGATLDTDVIYFIKNTKPPFNYRELPY